MTLIPWWGLLYHSTSSKYTCLPKMSSTNATVVGIRASMYEFWGSMNIQFIAFYPPNSWPSSLIKHIHSISTAPKVILASPPKVQGPKSLTQYYLIRHGWDLVAIHWNQKFLSVLFWNQMSYALKYNGETRGDGPFTFREKQEESEGENKKEGSPKPSKANTIRS